MGKILFIDVDGTLVNYENHLPDTAADAIKKARAAADYVTAGVDEDGLYKAFVHLGLLR